MANGDQTGWGNYNLTSDQYQQLLKQYPPSGGYGPTLQMSPEFNAAAAAIQAQNQGGPAPGGGQQGGPAAQGGGAYPNAAPLIGGAEAANAAGMNPLSAWGTKALQMVGMNTPMYLNQPPSGTPSGKSGVAPTSGPTAYDISGVPMPSTGWVSSMFNPQQTYTPSQATYQRPTPPPQAFAPSGTGAAAPFATPPPAPSINVPPAPTAPFAGGGLPAGGPPAAPGGQPGGLSAHMSGLANAGMALYAHYGGDPSSATPTDIANFHNELQGAIKGGAPIKMRSGGVVHGQPGPDRVPAMLTSGEFVMSKDAVNRIGADNLQAMNQPQHFQSGGSVDDDREPEEARHRTLSTQPPPSSASSAPSQAAPAAPTPAAPTPAQPDSGTSQGPAWQRYAAQAYANRMSLLGTNAYQAAPGSSALTVGDVASGAAVPGAGVTQQLGQLPSAAPAVADFVSNLASGLTKAAQTYADSVKPWIPQPSAIGRFGAPVAQSGPAATFKQPQAPGGGGQQSNPSDEYYRLRMMGLV